MKSHPIWATKLLLLRKAASLTLLFSFSLSSFAPLAHGQVSGSVSEQSGTNELSSSDGYDFAVNHAQAVMGSNYSPGAIRQVGTASEAEAPAAQDSMTGSFSGDSEMSLMSGESTTISVDHLYRVANDVRDSEVSGMSGAFTHSIPIVIPPGRNGMEPKITLQYSNQTREEVNVAGYGWDVPIPYIERQNETGTDSLYASNEFYSTLSGELATTSDSSQYVARSGDGSYLKYEFASSTNQWTVRSKDGLVHKFGHATTTQIASSTDSTKVFRWMLEETRDTNGNYVKYEYFKDGGFIYPDLITYTGNGVTNGILTVDFVLEGRTDNATSTAPGFKIESKYRIDTITAFVNGEWVRKYELSYTTGDNDRRSLLDTVLESARSTEGSPVTASLPAINLDYQTATPGWATSTDFSLPEKFLTGSYQDTGLRLVDLNGDALPDLVKAKQGTATTTFLNNGTGWATTTNWTFPVPFANSSGADEGARLADVNGDGLVDVLVGNNADLRSYLHTGSGWATSTTWASPYSFVGSGGDTGVRIADVNGDNLPDLLFATYYPQFGFDNNEVRLNTGSGWNTSSWKLPAYFSATWSSGTVFSVTQGTWVEDINNDGLADIVSFDNNVQGFNGVYLNTGNGWATSTTWTAPAYIGGSGYDYGQRLADVNGDDLPDWLGDGDVYLNTGHDWVLDNSWTVPVSFGGGAHITDLEGDGMLDLVERNDSTHNRYLANGNPVDALIRIDESTGGKVTVSYKGSAQYTDGSGNELNTDLPFSIQTANAVGYDDGFGVVATTSYSYDDGDLYFANSHDRTFAGFGMIQKTDPAGNVTKTYYHQGNASATTTGEHEDHRSKIGKAYRSETYDDGNELYTTQITKWENTNRGGEAEFARATRATTLSYDGDSDHRDTSETYSHSTTTGSITEKISWGEVAGSNDGSYTDTGSDKRTTAYTYAASSTGYLILPSQETVTNQSAAKVSEQKYYYDTLSQGSVNAGNLTKQESWRTGSSYIDIEKTYNAYGLVTQEKDPRGKITSFVYDAHNLYIATTTSPLSHVTERTYDYSSGKVLQTTDPNDRVFETVYDPFDRVKEEKQPDLTSPSTLVNKTLYQYTDTGFPRKVQRTDYLNASTTVDTYTYLNGAGKKVEERVEAEGTYSVKDFTYDKRGLLQNESLPYFSSGTSYTGTSSPAASSLLLTYVYDPFDRVLAVGNVVGTTTNAYDQWAVTTTDAEGSVKKLTKDAYGNLAEVVENNGGSQYTTTYEYDGNNKLTKITDAAANVRNFTYDGLGRRLTAQDLHDTGDATYGTWTYAYDDAGNLASTTDPKSQQIDFTYDDLNRPLTENYTGAAGTEVSYSYDSCSEGVGRLCTATSTGAAASFGYNALGGVASEVKTISGIGYTTAYTYDRLGNIVGIIYPDSSEVSYSYNSAGQLESVAQKESGGSFADVVSDFDYAPTGKISYKEFGNGATSEYMFNANRLYRLTRIYTHASSTGGMGGGGSDLALVESALSEIMAEQNLTLEELESPQVLLDLANEDLLSDSQIELPFDEEASVPPSLEEPLPPESDPIGQLPQPEASVSSETGTGTEATTTLPVEGILPDLTATTTPEIVASSTNAVDPLLLLPVDDEKLKVKASFDKHLGHKEFKNGLLKYAYQTDTKVDVIPAGTETIAQARERGFVLGEEDKAKRTKYARTFETDVEGVFVTEFVAGDPQYYKDETSEWWLADYGVTTAASYKFQEEKDKKEKEAVIEIPQPEVPKKYKDVPELQPVMPDALESHVELPHKEVSLIEKAARWIKEGSRKALAFVGHALGIIPMRAYAASSTFYPDPDTETSSVDGRILKDDDTNWSTTRNATTGRIAGSDNETMTAETKKITGNKFYLSRLFILFDTSSLPDSTQIISADLSFYIIGVGHAGSNPKKLYISSSSPASNTDLIENDYDMIGSTSFGESDGTYVNNTYEAVALNASGLANISKTGVSKFSGRTYHDMYNSTPSSTDYLTFQMWSSEQTGTSNDPKLVVIYGNPPTAPTSLLAEGQSSPTGIQDVTPELSAVFNDTDAGDTAGSYQIQVSTTTSFASTVWDSGKTTLASSTPAGTRIADIAYGGSRLNVDTTYYWRIKFWDDTNVESSWSVEQASFSLSNTLPNALLTEGQVNPISLSDNTPEFSAIHNDIYSTDLATHYQIQVATSTDFESVYWDSGLTALASSTPPSQRIQDVSYAGSALASTTSYYWRVKFKDSNNEESQWSDTASFFFTLGGSTEVVQDINFTYDKVGNITRIDDHSGTVAAKVILYSYDDLHRLTSASTTAASSTPFSETYSYSSIGNITSKSDQGLYTYSETGYTNPHAPTAIASTSLSYDQNGSLTASGSDTYAWDYRNRLASSTTSGIGLSYAYDHTEQRVAKVSTTSTTIYPNRYYDTDGSAVTKHLFARGELIASIETVGATSTIEYIHADHLGSTNDTTGSFGTVVSTLDYLPFGSERIASGNPSTNRHFIGERRDSESDLNYLNNRFYENAQGQFLSQDPVFWEVGLTNDGRSVLTMPQLQNSYGYAGNNPVTARDPSGRIVESGFDVVMVGISISNFANDPSWSNAGSVALDAASLALPGVPAVGGTAIRAGKISNTTSNTQQVANQLPDSTLVCRGGSCTAQQFENAKGASVGADGKLRGVSVNSAPNTSVKNLTKSIPHGQVGVTTVGNIRGLGGNVVPSPTKNNPFHALLEGLSPRQGQSLFQPTRRNPNR